MKYLEDFAPGATMEFTPFTVDETEIIAFAKRYDAQPFHVDGAVAERSPFGGIIASGFHTCAMAMASLVNGGFFDASGMGSPGLDEIRWHRPVRGGQRLRARTQILATTPSKSKPDRGVVRHRVELLNDRDEAVMSFVAMSMFPTRPESRS